MSNMHPRWIVDVNGDCEVVVVHAPPDGRIFLYRATWVHNCLELDVKNRTAVYRDQPDGSNDDPRDWPSIPFPLRRVLGRWQTYVEREDWERWVVNRESSVQHAKEITEKHPEIVVFDMVSEEMEKLEAVRSAGFGWVDLAPDVSNALDAELGSEDTENDR